MLKKVQDGLQEKVKPVVDFWGHSFSTWQALAAQQSSLATSLVSENMRFFENCRNEPGPSGFINAQKQYMEGVQASFSDAGNSYMRLMSENQQRVAELFGGFGETILQKGATFIPAAKK